MKPDWQNKSYAKNGAATGPSTTHPKLKVGMSSLHSKIAVANHNTVQAKKPAVRKFADGGTVLKTRSDEEIGDTDTKSGRVDPGSFDRRAAQGEKNLQMLKDAFNRFTGEKSATTSTATTESKQPVDRFAGGMSPEAPAKQTKTETATEPSYMKDVRDTLTKPKAETTSVEPSVPATMEAEPVSKKAMPKAKPKAKQTESVKQTGSPDMPASDVKPTASPKPVAKSQPMGETYRRLDGTIGRASPKLPPDQQWGVQNIIPNLKDDVPAIAGAVVNYFKNMETPSQRRERERKEAK